MSGLVRRYLKGTPLANLETKAGVVPESDRWASPEEKVARKAAWYRGCVENNLRTDVAWFDLCQALDEAGISWP